MPVCVPPFSLVLSRSVQRALPNDARREGQCFRLRGVDITAAGASCVSFCVHSCVVVLGGHPFPLRHETQSTINVPACFTTVGNLVWKSRMKSMLPEISKNSSFDRSACTAAQSHFLRLCWPDTLQSCYGFVNAMEVSPRRRAQYSAQICKRCFFLK